jgi:hypothetical protein
MTKISRLSRYIILYECDIHPIVLDEAGDCSCATNDYPLRRLNAVGSCICRVRRSSLSLSSHRSRDVPRVVLARARLQHASRSVDKAEAAMRRPPTADRRPPTADRRPPTHKSVSPTPGRGDQILSWSWLSIATTGHTSRERHALELAMRRGNV